jgi:hypothetical protein
MDQQSLQAGDLETSTSAYEAPRIVLLGSVNELTQGSGGAGTDSVEAASLGYGS